MNRCDGGGGGAGDENVRVKRGRCALTASPLSIKIRRRRRSVVVRRRRRRRHGRRRLRRGTSKEGGRGERRLGMWDVAAAPLSPTNRRAPRRPYARPLRPTLRRLNPL